MRGRILPGDPAYQPDRVSFRHPRHGVIDLPSDPRLLALELRRPAILAALRQAGVDAASLRREGA